MKREWRRRTLDPRHVLREFNIRMNGFVGRDGGPVVEAACRRGERCRWR